MSFKDIALGGAVNPKQPLRFKTGGEDIARRENGVGPRLKRLEGFNAKFIRRGGVAILELPARSLFSTYTLESNPLTATDAGSSATINVKTFKIFWPDKPDGIQYRPFSLTGLAYSTTYRAYIDNPLRNGVVDHCHRGAIPVTGSPENIVARQDTEGRIYLGIIVTPAAAAGDTTGSGGGKGALATISDWDTEVRSRPVELTDGRVAGALRSDKTYTDPALFQKSAVRKETTAIVGGINSTTSWVTVDSFTRKLSPGTTKFLCTLDCIVTPNGASAWQGKARIKINAALSAEVVVDSPATSNSAAVTITGLTGDTTVTVEIQSIRVFSIGGPPDITGRFTQVTPADDDQSHWSI